MAGNYDLKVPLNEPLAKAASWRTPVLDSNGNPVKVNGQVSYQQVDTSTFTANIVITQPRTAAPYLTRDVPMDASGHLTITLTLAQVSGLKSSMIYVVTVYDSSGTAIRELLKGEIVPQ